MSSRTSPHVSRPRALAPGRLSRRIRFALVLEHLECRQLLSVSGAGLSQIAAQPFLGAAPLVSQPNPTGLAPSQVRNAYGVNQISFQGGKIAGNGAGQTIAVVDAYDDPNIGSDLKQFDRQFGLSDPPSFIKYVQSGLTQSDPGWSLETALDIEWAHAIAPAANLVLVEARSTSLNDLFGAVNFARSLNGVVAVSMSWGTSEFYGEWSYDRLFATPAGHIGGSGLAGGVTFLAASGDSGAWYGASYPSASPNVLSVGGTTLSLSGGTTYAGESGWVGSGGGFSWYESAPAYQTAAQGTVGLGYGLRTTPDVSMVANPATGVAVYDTVPYNGQTGWYAVGGTSASTPQWAGLIAIADQGLTLAGKGSLAGAQAALYSIPSSSFHDILSGWNGYSATRGYDLVTGLGSPIATRVVAGLLGTQGVYSVTGFPAPAAALSPAATSHAITLSSSNGNGSSTGSTSPSSLFPVFPNFVVVIVPFGTTQVVVVLPLVSFPTTLNAFSNHGVQQPLVSLASSNTQSLSVLNRFGQVTTLDDLPLQLSQFSNEPRFAALIDVVEPLEGPLPGVAPDKASTASESTATAMTAGRPETLHSSPGMDEILGSAQTMRLPSAFRHRFLPIEESDPENESQLDAWSRSALAGVVALASGGCWITLRENDRRKRILAEKRGGTGFRPRPRRFSFALR